MSADAVALTRELLAFDTINPPGREHDCARHAGALLESWGFRVDYHDYEPGRTSVVARAGGSDDKAPLCLTGHIDTVALGARPWSKDPFSGETDGDKLYGRGSSDMKAGVAAILLAARSFSKKLDGTPGLVIVLTAAEEGGCIGSQPPARPPVWTSPQQGWVERVFDICKTHLGARPEAKTATYMTGAGNLLKAYAGAPTIVLGPGEPQMAHQTDEWCSMERIRQAVAMYEALIKDWCRV